jgi:hypothetical protein
MKAFAAHQRERFFVIGGNGGEEKLFVLADDLGLSGFGFYRTHIRCLNCDLRVLIEIQAEGCGC